MNAFGEVSTTGKRHGSKQPVKMDFSELDESRAEMDIEVLCEAAIKDYKEFYLLIKVINDSIRWGK